MAWGKTGKEADRALEALEAEQRHSGVPRFWMKPKTKRRLFFLDGALDDDGVLERFMEWEHSLQKHGRFGRRFISCHQDQGHECPVCGDDQPYFARYLTVINCTPYRSRAGKVTNFRKELFVAKQGTSSILQEVATEYGGLRRKVVNVSRSSADAANVGDIFMPSEYPMQDFVDRVKAYYGKYQPKLKLTKDFFMPYKYPDVLPIYDLSQLSAMGFGSGAELGGDDFSNEDDELFQL